MKRILAIHDLSCFGRCALTVVMPIISSMGHQVVPLPTALLSTHTGGFDDLHFRDLTDDMEATVRHFERLGLTFDAIYSGFLGSARQIDIVSDIIRRFGQRPSRLGGRSERVPVIVDPVMGDDGSLYSTYTDELVAGVGRLCARAGGTSACVITPNLTEACFLVGRPHPGELADEEAVCTVAGELCRELFRLYGTRRIVITGICTGTTVTNACFEDGRLDFVSARRLGRSFPGTGEVFASVLAGMLTHGAPLCTAVRAAEDFTFRVIEASQASPEPSRDGVLLEGQLGLLTKYAAGRV